MEISNGQAAVILEMIGHNQFCGGNTPEEENLDYEIRNSFSTLEDYDYAEERKKYGW